MSLTLTSCVLQGCYIWHLSIHYTCQIIHTHSLIVVIVPCFFSKTPTWHKLSWHWHWIKMGVRPWKCNIDLWNQISVNWFDFCAIGLNRDFLLWTWSMVLNSFQNLQESLSKLSCSWIRPSDVKVYDWVYKGMLCINCTWKLKRPGLTLIPLKSL